MRTALKRWLPWVLGVALIAGAFWGGLSLFYRLDKRPQLVAVETRP